MNDNRLVRDYENAGLPLKERLPSLARRFTCLKNARGVSPWSGEVFHNWVVSQGEGSAAWHAGHLLLNLSGEGPWAQFDAISAISVWNDSDRSLFSTWARSWH